MNQTFGTIKLIVEYNRVETKKKTEKNFAIIFLQIIKRKTITLEVNSDRKETKKKRIISTYSRDTVQRKFKCFAITPVHDRFESFSFV